MRARRGAIIGFGNVAEKAHMPAWAAHADFRIAAVVDPDHERRERARALVPDVTVHEDLAALRAHAEVDFVDICTPPRDHAEMVLGALDAGWHVFCEKPLVPSVEHMRRIETGAAGTDRVVFCVDNWKHAPIWDLALKLIEDGAIGAVRELDITVLRPPGAGGGRSDWRRVAEISGGGILLDHGWHNLYLMLSLVQRAPTAVSATMAFAAGTSVDEVVDLQIRFEHVVARAHLTWRADRRENAARVCGTDGVVALNDDHLLVTSAGGAEQHHDLGEALSASSHHASWMVPVVDAFAAELTGTRQRGRNLAEAGWCARLVDHAYRSARAGGAWVKVDEHPPAVVPHLAAGASRC